MTTSNHWLAKLLFFTGTILITVNIFGQFISLRNPAIMTEPNVAFKNDITLTEDQVYSTINSRITDRKTYIKKMNKTINEGIAHYWEEEGIDKYHLRIPFYENYILFIASYIMPEKFLKYEFLDYHRAIERGVGPCSQHAIILAEVLFEKGIKTKMVGLAGHVVMTAQVDENTNEWWVVDPDYGVIIPYDLDAIEKKPELIVPYYSEAGYDNTAVSSMEKYYGKDGNELVKGYGIGDYSKLTNYFEKASYILIWLIPSILLLPLCYFLFISKKTRNNNKM